LRTRANSPSIEEDKISLEGKASPFLGEGRTLTSPNPFALDLILIFFVSDMKSVELGSNSIPGYTSISRGLTCIPFILSCCKKV